MLGRRAAYLTVNVGTLLATVPPQGCEVILIEILHSESGENIESDNVYEMVGQCLYEPDALELASKRDDQPDHCERERLTGLSRLDNIYKIYIYIIKRLGEWRGMKTAFFIIHPSSKLISCV